MSTRRTLLGGLILALTIVLLFGIQVGSVFELKDDHRIIRFSDSAQNHYQVPSTEGDFISDYFREIRIDAEQVGRFRPLTWVLEIGLPRSLGTEPILWRIAWVGLSVVFGLLLYALGLRVFEVYSISVVFVLVAVLSPDPGALAIWYKPGARSEAFGALFIVGAMLIATYAPNRNGILLDSLVFAFLLLAALTKESFILLIPAIALFRVWIEMQMTRRKFYLCVVDLRFLLTTYLFLFLSALSVTAYIAITAGSQSYGGRSMATSVARLIEGMQNSIIHAPGMAVWFLPVIGAGALGIWKLGVVLFMKKIWLPILIFLLWIAPQFLLYATRGGMWDHYWMPTIIALSGLNAAALFFISVNSSATLRVLFWGVTAIWLINAIRVDIPAMMNYGSKANMQQTVVRAVASRLESGKQLVIVSDMSKNSELAFSIIYFASYYGASGFDAILYDISEESESDRKQSGSYGFTKSTIFPNSPDFTEFPATCVEAIIFLDKPSESDEHWVNWFDSGDFEMHSAVGVQRHLAVKKLKLDEQYLRLDYAVNRSNSSSENCARL